MLALVNAVALITGASRGIGRGIALELAAIGCDLALNYVSNVSAAQKTADDCATRAQAKGHNIRTRLFRADIGEEGDRQQLLEFVRSEYGRLDLLINNAGVAPTVRADLLETSEESFDRVLRINLKGPYFLTQAAARWMIEQARTGIQRATISPKIITVSSISAYTVSVDRPEYCISKAALSMVTQLFAARLAEHGIGVYELRPGIVRTDMTQPVKAKYDSLIEQGLTPIRRWGTPQDVGLTVATLAQDRLPFSTGQVINVDGGFHIRRL